MVRKQFRLDETQAWALEKRARALGVSQSEIVRRALDTVLVKPERARSTDRAAIVSFLARATAIAKTHPLPSDYRFNRQNLHDEDRRFKRWKEE